MSLNVADGLYPISLVW